MKPSLSTILLGNSVAIVFNEFNIFMMNRTKYLGVFYIFLVEVQILAFLCSTGNVTIRAPFA